jgi:ABC-type multidrug transport system fused ATPase/permease subunit
MNLGRIIDIGTHEQLVESCELYRHLYRTQLAATGG